MTSSKTQNKVEWDINKHCWLHNMSAPPRSTITLSPLRQRNDDTSLEDVGTNVLTSHGGLRWITRINLDMLIQCYFPDFKDSRGYGSWNDLKIDIDDFPNDADVVVNGKTLLATESKSERLNLLHIELSPYLRLRCCVVIARSLIDSTQSVSRIEVERLRDNPFEQLCDALRDANATLNPKSLDLPPLGVMIKADNQSRPHETSAARVFYSLSRLNGQTFVRSASAMVAGRLHGNICMDLWVPS